MDLSSAYSATISENTVVKPSISYSFDGFPLDETVAGVKENALSVLKNAALFNTTYNLYSSLSSSKPSGGGVSGQSNAAGSLMDTTKDLVNTIEGQG